MIQFAFYTELYSAPPTVTVSSTISALILIESSGLRHNAKRTILNVRESVYYVLWTQNGNPTTCSLSFTLMPPRRTLQ